MNAITAAKLGLGAVTHLYGHFEALLRDYRVQPWPENMNYNDEQLRFTQVARLWNLVHPPGSPEWKEYLKAHLALNTIFDPTMTAYAAGRDVMRMRNADWHDRYSLPSRMDFYATRSRTGSSTTRSACWPMSAPWSSVRRRSEANPDDRDAAIELPVRAGASVMIVLTLLLTLHVGLLSAAGQSQGAVSEARRLRDSRAFAEAVKVLERHLQGNPEDREALRLHAQTLYWLEQHDRARAAYAAALTRYPDDEALRLEYARMLADTGRLREAVRLLEEHRRDMVASADADALLGTVLYWSGDWTAAKKLFVEALRKAPAHQAAAQQLMEIETASSSWLSLTPSVWHDDQPVDRAGVAFEVGWFATPLLSLTFRSQPDRYAVDGSRTFWKNEAELLHFAPAARLETRVAAGVLRRAEGAEPLQWIARGELAVRAGRGVTLRGRIERTPYVHTVASLDTPVTSDNFAGLVQWNHPRGWLAEAAVQRQRFADANQVRGSYAWALAPLIESGGSRLQAGYSLSTADADEDRFVLARAEQPVLPTNPQFDFSGVYHPYHTPARSRIHSVIGAITARSATGLTFRGSGSYGFRAHEDATVFFPLGTQVGATTIRRTFRPWTARASFEVPASRALRVSVQGESGRTAFYHWTSASVHLLVRLLPPRNGRLQPQ